MTIERSTLDQVRDYYLKLPNQQKLVVLTALSNSLTVDGRGFFLDLSGERLVQALRGLNELQHQINCGLRTEN